MNKLRHYLIILPTLLLLVVSFMWYQASQRSDALIVEPVLLGETSVSQSLVDQETLLAKDETDENQLIYVDVKGAVRYPNVYALPLGSRLFDAIEKAGGLLPEAATQHLNQSLLLSDQMLIYIYTVSEMEESQLTPSESDELPLVSGPQLSQTPAETEAGRVNINQATVAELMTLPGIGPKKAEAIIQYRSEHGSFATPEALMEVSGIGQKTYEQLASLIAVD